MRCFAPLEKDRGAYRVFVTKSGDRKSTRLNSSHVRISYAVFCLKKKISNLAQLLADRDGAVCIALALPLTLPLGALGGAVAYALRCSRRGGRLLPGALCPAALLL